MLCWEMIADPMTNAQWPYDCNRYLTDAREMSGEIQAKTQTNEN